MTLLSGDCLERLPELPDDCVDLVLVDLPYGTTKCPWDSTIPFGPMWEHLHRVAKRDAAMVFFAAEPFTSALVMSNVREYRQKLTWLKTRPVNVMNAKKMFMNWTEDIVVFYRSLPTFHPQFWDDGRESRVKIQHTRTDRSEGVMGRTGEREGHVSVYGGDRRYPKTVLEFSNVHNGKDHLHPTQKPVPLLEYLVRTYTNPQDVVLDFCMGSGSTGVACANLGREFIGIEKDGKYFDIANERVHRAYEAPRQDTFEATQNNANEDT